MDIKKTIKSIPLSSGVYLMKDKKDRVLYIGKAVSLRKRVQSYFRVHKNDPKTDALVLEIFDINYIVTASEAEALILEASLIQKFRPKYNIDLKDDKSYPFIQITKEDFSRVSVVRPRMKKIQKIAKFFGPYVNAKLIREALVIIRRIFHFRACRIIPKKACLDFHIGLCDAPCINNVSKKEYRCIIRNVCLVLEGRKDDLYRGLRKQMEGFSQKKEFEKAAKVRDQIQAIGALYTGSADVNYFKEAEQLQRALSLSRRPERIEAFDISNIMGQQAVGSMVSFLNGKPDKKNYRRFRIRETKGIDDFRMMAEVVRRRYMRLKKEKALFPDLILIDGGKGQLSSAKFELDKLEVQVPVVSLAKRNEELFLPQKRNSISLKKDSLGLRLVQRIRDEAHRFAVSYHRKLRGKDVFEKK
ncbi:MAG: excinuclease ABC subunit UvrC [Candidatus Aceula meridiana]|nr:excinuclease ABC subunit UvrC [Candidatus Aceula meridiana]